MAESDSILDLPPDELARWLDKTNFAPGVPLDEKLIPVLRYLKQGTKVATLQKWRDGSTVRGFVSLTALNNLRDEPATEDGWYASDGTFLGDNPQFPEFEEPEFPRD